MERKKIDIFIDEMLEGSKKFVTSVRVWNDYTKDESYYALATFLEKVLIPALERSIKKDEED